MFRDDREEVLARNIAFTTDSNRKGALLHILAIKGVTGPAVKPLEKWNFPADWREYMDACITRDRGYWEKRKCIHDDMLPTMKPFYGIAIHSSFLGGRVTYGGNTSFQLPFITDWSQLEDITLCEDEPNLRMLLDSMRYLQERGKQEGFYASLRGGDSPMDIANAIRGNDFFMDMLEEEDATHDMLKLCVQAAKWTWSHQMDIIEPVQGGYISGQAVWLPDYSIGHLSEDASALSSPALYEEFGRPYTEQLLEPYDCAIMHVHTKGRHALKSIAAIEKIKFIQLEYDPNEPPPIEVYKQNADALRDKIVVPIMTTDEIAENLDFLAPRKSIIQVYAQSMEDAERAVELTREIRGL